MAEAACQHYYLDPQEQYYCVASCPDTMYEDGKFCRNNCTVFPNIYISGSICTSGCAQPSAIPLKGTGNVCDSSCLYATYQVEEDEYFVCVSSCYNITSQPFTDVDGVTDGRYHCVSTCDNITYLDYKQVRKC